MNQSLRQMLTEVINENEIDNWLNTPNKAFDNKKPCDATDEEINQMIYMLKSGLPI